MSSGLPRLNRLHAEGFGVTIQWYADDDQIAVVLWRGSKIVGSGRSDSLEGALHSAEGAASRPA